MSALLTETLLVWLFSASLWFSFRVLRYPDLGAEQVAVLLGAFWIWGLSKGIGMPLIAVGLFIVAGALVATVTFLRVVLKVNGILVALSVSYAAYSLSLVVMAGPNMALNGHVVPPIADEAITRVVAGIVTFIFIYHLLQSKLGAFLRSAGSNQGLFEKLVARKRLFWIKYLGHYVSLIPLGLFSVAIVSKGGSLDVGITYGRLLQGLFVIIVTLSIYPRCNFSIAGPLMLIPAVITVFVARLILELGISASLFTGAMAALMLLFVILIKPAGARVFRLEDVLKS